MAHFRYIGLVVAAAALMVLGVPAASQAQEGYNAGGSTAPDGWWLAGGPNAGAALGNKSPDGAGIRLEGGIPLTLVGPGQLSLVLPVSTVTEGFPGGRVNSITFYPEVQWEYVFPIHMQHRFSIAPQAGFGIGGVWAHVNSGGSNGAFMIGFKTGVVLRFVFDFGLLLETQPMGFTFNIPFGNNADFYTSYEWYAGVGYRWK